MTEAIFDYGDHTRRHADITANAWKKIEALLFAILLKLSLALTHMQFFLYLPNTNSMKKKSTENKCGRYLNFAIASGYEMNAKPAPPFTTLEMSVVFVSSARLPSMAKITQPASIEVQESIVVTIMTSLCNEKGRVG